MGPGENSSYTVTKSDGLSDCVDAEGRRCATRKVVRSNCSTEEVEPGRFVRKCEKTEQVFKDCLRRPSEMIQSNSEYSEEDITDDIRNHSYSAESSIHRGASAFPPYFPGLRSDAEAIERDFLGGFGRLFGAAEEMANEFFNSVRGPYDRYGDAFTWKKPGIYTESEPGEPLPKKTSDGYVDLSGLGKEV